MHTLFAAAVSLSLALVSHDRAGSPAHSEKAESPEPKAVIAYSTRGDESVHFVSAADLSLISSHKLGLGAHELAISPDGRWLIGTAYGGPGAGHQPADSRLAVMDLSTMKIHRTIDLAPMSRPNDVAFMPDSSHAYVTIEAPPRIVRVNPQTGERTTITLDHGTNHMLALSRDASRLYVAHVMPGRLTSIDTATNKVLSSVELPTGAEGVAVGRDGSRVYVACNRSDIVAVVDPDGGPEKTGVVERRVACPGFPFRARVSPDGSLLAVSCPKGGDVALFQTGTMAEPTRISVQPTGDKGGVVKPNTALVPTSIAFTADGTHLAVMCDGAKPGIVLISIAERKVVARRDADGPIADALTTGVLR